jgi:hypothetical protein
MSDQPDQLKRKGLHAALIKLIEQMIVVGDTGVAYDQAARDFARRHPDTIAESPR